MERYLIRARRELLEKEKGTIYKTGKWRILLISPLSYPAGSTSLAMHILYREWNRLDDVSCERYFFKEEEVRSLEGDRQPSEFHILAFTLSYELDCLKFLKILEMSGIPLLREERGEQHPIVLIGGAYPTINPHPLSKFADAIAIGDGEELVREIVNALKEGKGKRETIELLKDIDGIYVPYLCKGYKRRWLRDLNVYDGSSQFISPLSEFPSTAFVEISRGCNRGCAFCVIPAFFSPYRERSVEKILEQALKWKGVARKVGLVGAATSDHSALREIGKALYQEGIPFSAASLRADALEEEFLQYLAKSGEMTVTLAPEVATPPLRKLIRKWIDEEVLREALEKAKRVGFKRARLYFMIGLPGEGMDDVQAIVELAERMAKILPLHLSVAPFVPKPGTPLASYPMEKEEVLRKKVRVLQSGLKKKGIGVSFESIRSGIIQWWLAQGDERMGDVLLYAYKRGGSFSAWKKGYEKVYG
ncbi:radical SAM protein [bacterium]|nr:radical SAM protein [bacterium]